MGISFVLILIVKLSKILYPFVYLFSHELIFPESTDNDESIASSAEATKIRIWKEAPIYLFLILSVIYTFKFPIKVILS